MGSQLQLSLSRPCSSSQPGNPLPSQRLTFHFRCNTGYNQGTARAIEPARWGIGQDGSGRRSVTGRGFSSDPRTGNRSCGALVATRQPCLHHPRETSDFLEEALFNAVTGRSRTLLEKWRMPLDQLRIFAVTHELGHALCQETDEARVKVYAVQLRSTGKATCLRRSDQENDELESCIGRRGASGTLPVRSTRVRIMSETAAHAHRLVRFGVYELDLHSGELRKSGARLSLQQQPLQLLSVLLEQPGQLVTRDELRKRLWPDDTFVDFEHGLNAAVKAVARHAWRLGRLATLRRDRAAARLPVHRPGERTQRGSSAHRACSRSRASEMALDDPRGRRRRAHRDRELGSPETTCASNARGGRHDTTRPGGACDPIDERIRSQHGADGFARR